jgi:small subunit ribosomal protein S14
LPKQKSRVQIPFSAKKRLIMSNLIQRDKKKRELYLKNEIKRLNYKSLFNDLSLEKEDRYYNMLALNKIVRNSSRVRIKNRCILTGRTHSIYKLFKLSRIKFRELASQGVLMGITKASW